MEIVVFTVLPILLGALGIFLIVDGCRGLVKSTNNLKSINADLLEALKEIREELRFSTNSTLPQHKLEAKIGEAYKIANLSIHKAEETP